MYISNKIIHFFSNERELLVETSPDRQKQGRKITNNIGMQNLQVSKAIFKNKLNGGMSFIWKEKNDEKIEEIVKIKKYSDR